MSDRQVQGRQRTLAVTIATRRRWSGVPTGFLGLLFVSAEPDGTASIPIRACLTTQIVQATERAEYSAGMHTTDSRAAASDPRGCRGMG